MGDTYRLEWRKGKRLGYALWDVDAQRVEVFTKTGNVIFPGAFSTGEGWNISRVVERLYVVDLYIVEAVWKQVPIKEWRIEVSV